MVRFFFLLPRRAIIETEEKKGHVILAVGQQGRQPAGVHLEAFLPKRPISDIPLSQTPPVLTRRRQKRRSSLPDIVDLPVCKDEPSDHRLTNSPVQEPDCSFTSPEPEALPSCKSEDRRGMMRSSSATSFARKGHTMPSRMNVAIGVPLAVTPCSLGRRTSVQKVSKLVLSWYCLCL